MTKPLRTIKSVHPAYQDDVADLHTVRPLPSPRIQMLDPFLFLNHHGPQIYSPQNRGLPFGPHPHRGFQTVTFILEGDIAHRDSAGHESVIGPMGVQWMSAGQGLVHEEISSADFKRRGGPLEILQLWVNLPAKLKMSKPYYKGLQAADIPVVKSGGAQVQVIAGSFGETQGPFTPSTDLTVLTLALAATAEHQSTAVFEISVPRDHTLFFYVVRGEVSVNGRGVSKENLVEFQDDGDIIRLQSSTDAFILLCHAKPYGEPVAFGGPFVMNTREEIQQAYLDYQNGKFGGGLS